MFGSEHSKNCFARDLLEREANIVLIDEFDKVSPQFYNAFYQVFDEGIYSDSHYEVNVKNCIFICTSNYQNEQEALQNLGAPIYSRFTDIIAYTELSNEHKIKIVEEYYDECIDKLAEDEKMLFIDNKILKFFLDNVSRFNNVRIIKSKLEKAVYREIVLKFVCEEEN